jgi:hypothetical protein
VNAGGGKVYKVNRQTGDTWLLTGMTELLISDSEESDLDRAIKDAKQSKILSDEIGQELPAYMSTNELMIIRTVEQTHGITTIRGWRGQMVGDRTYLVSFEFEHVGHSVLGFYFEVNRAASVVRNIFADSELHKKYASHGINPVYRLDRDGETVIPIPTSNGQIIWDPYQPRPNVGAGLVTPQK